MESTNVLKGLKMTSLKEVLDLCPSAYRFMSINCLLKTVVAQMVDKIKDDHEHLAKTFIQLNSLITSIYKGDVYHELKLSNCGIKGIEILIKETENESLKEFLTSLRKNIENILTINKFKKQDYYDIPEHSNFFNVPISRILRKGKFDRCKRIKEEERRRIYTGTFLPLMARTGFAISEFASIKVSQIVDRIVKNNVANYVSKSPNYLHVKNKNMMTWMIQKYLLSGLDCLKKLDSNRTKIENSCVRPILEILSPTYISQLLENDNMKELNAELENYSDKCDKLGEALINHEEAFKEILLAESIFWQFSLFLKWSHSQDGLAAYTTFCETHRTPQQKIEHYNDYLNAFASWKTRYIAEHQLANFQNLFSESTRSLVDVKSPEYQEWISMANATRAIHSLLVVTRLQIRSHADMVETYESLKQNRTKITLSEENPDHSVPQATHEASRSVLQDTNLLSLSPDSPQAPFEPNDSPQVDDPVSSDKEIVHSEEPAEAVAILHETIGHSFEKFFFTHPLANQALKDARQAHQNLVAELMFPATVTDPEAVASHANALVRFTSTMMEGLVTAFVIEQQQPQMTGDYSWLKHNILAQLKDDEIDPRFMNTAWRSSQLEQRMRYLHTESASQNPVLDLLRQAEHADTEEDCSVIMHELYEFVRTNLQAVGSVFNIGEHLDFTHIAGNYHAPKTASLPSDHLAKRLAARLEDIDSEIGDFLSVSPPTTEPSKTEVSNYLADAAHLLNLMKARMKRTSNIAVEYYELSTLLPLAIESLVISIAGRPGGTIDLSKLDRKRMGHNLLELYAKNKIEQLSKNFKVNPSHIEFMKESRTLLPLTRYSNVQRMMKGNRLNKSLAEQVKLSAAAKVHVQGEEWTPAPISKRVHHGQLQLRYQMLQRAEKGISFVEALLEVCLKLHDDASQLTA
ncbi:MAG: hypothetical protein Q8K75_01150 [Chlamydiales bacterium]|nr:hypothetical protein [Chlamydiales bacterium]